MTSYNSGTPTQNRTPQSIGFLLLDNFTLISLASAVEPLRMANQLSGRELYRWSTLSVDGGQVWASDGLQITPDAAMHKAPAMDTVIVCGGIGIQRTVTREHVSWLQSQARQSRRLGAVCTGSWALACAGLAHAASDAKNSQASAPAGTSSSDRAMATTAQAEREQLEKALTGVKTVTGISAKLSQMGYQITAINDADKNSMEYEVVKGPHSHEVTLDLSGGQVTDVSVAANLWRADSTKLALEGKKVQAIKSSDFSDRRFMPAWNAEKQALQKSMTPGKAPADYLSQLQGLGYTVTSVNDREKDYVEVEIVKGQNSYEVQLDLNTKTGKAEKVDVTNNLWESDATEAALKRRGG